MSGIYIPMEMPTSCRACMFSRTDIRNVDWCVLTEKDLPCDCPIVPIPQHGRLIDADALPRFGGRKGLVHSSDVNNATTVIPADQPVMYYPQVPGITPTVISDKEEEG